jgi:CRISPR-associated exonuclease Cas4
MADAVEFRSASESESAKAPFPVEYKRGKPKEDESDLVQLCAQAFCLEEMLGVEVSEGAFFYQRERRRTRVRFSDELRRITAATALRIHELMSVGKTPPPEYSKRCRSCSLMDVCQPRACGGESRVARYLNSALEML